jgi:hypothetical protein
MNQPIAIAADRFVRIPLFAALTGITEKAVERMIEDGVWLEGEHYRRKNGRIYIDREAYQEWVQAA